MSTRLRSATACLALALALAGHANNIQVSNVTLTGQNTTNNTWQVRFNVSWENSWRTSTLESNWDAAWIFIKFRQPPGYTYGHCVLNATGHVTPVGATMTVPADLRGVFLNRSANGTGNVNYTNVELQWNYGLSGIGDADPMAVSVQAIEMVYSPQGAFRVGDGSGTANGFNAGIATSTTYQITSENAISLGGILSTNLCAANNLVDDFNNSTIQNLPASFPKGFQAFYAMKYEMSQGQYADFLNKLPSAQATARYPDMNGTLGHTINAAGVSPNIYVADAPDRACNFIDFVDLCAYADWAALRPLTELEYEKLCRGDRTPSPGEFAWGSALIRGSTPYTLSNFGQPNEIASNPESGALGNAHFLFYAPTYFPFRVGVFAASVASPNRTTSGGGFTGALELTGNVFEQCVWLGHSPGRAFTGSMGDGSLDANGVANVAGWSGITMVKLRGGGIGQNVGKTVSSRDINGGVNPNEVTGGRLCRTP